MIKPLFSYLKTHPKTILIILSVLIILVLIFPNRQSNKNADSDTQNQIIIPAFNQDVNPQPQSSLTEKVGPKTISVFEPLTFSKDQVMSFFQPIVNEFQFSQNSETINI